MISLGSLDEVVFMLQVNRSDLGLMSPATPPPTDTPPRPPVTRCMVSHTHTSAAATHRVITHAPEAPQIIYHIQFGANQAYLWSFLGKKLQPSILTAQESDKKIEKT